MARASAKATEDQPASEPVTEAITYVPGPMDPPVTKWCGHTFQANVPKEITGHPDGSEREKLSFHLIERARENKLFRVGNAARKRDAVIEPRNSQEYRAYVVNWLQDPSIEHADQLIARFAKDRDLQAACEVGFDDYAYISTLFMPKLYELARGDDLNEPQVASLWISHGINQLPW